MIKETITYVDYDGNERTEDFFFNLNKAELMEMQLSKEGGLEKKINKIIQTQDSKELIELFKEIIIKAYGVKSDDGKRFIKNDEVKAAFLESEAYSELFMKLATDTDAATRFINGVIPQEANKPHPIPDGK